MKTYAERLTLTAKNVTNCCLNVTIAPGFGVCLRFFSSFRVPLR